MTDESTINKIMGLLAKAEATEFEEEAATYLAKAQELMIKHAVDQADLQPEQREQITTVTVNIANSGPNDVLLAVIARSLDVQAINLGATAGQARITLIGFETDLEYVQVLYASLLLQREAAVGREFIPPWESARSFKHAFRQGFATRVSQRLEAAKAVTVNASDSKPGTALVLASKKELVDQRFREMFPKTRKRKATASSRSGFDAGQEAGGRANLNAGRNNLSQRRAAIR